MEKKKTWYSYLVGCIILCCVIFFLLTIWIFHKVSNTNNSNEVQELLPELSQMTEQILPQLSYRNSKFELKKRTPGEQLMLAIKIAYFTKEVKKATISYGEMRQIQVDAKAVHHILETYFGLHYERNLKSEKKPIYLTYDEIRDLYLLNVTNDFWDYKNTYHYKITNIQREESNVILSLESSSQENKIHYEATFLCKQDCYFISSKIIN